MAANFLTTVAAANTLFSVCRTLLRQGGKVYVTDKSGVAFMTLTTSKSNIPISVEISAQSFKSYFGRYSALVKSGFCFALTLKGETRVVYARRHTKFVDPLQSVVDEWIEKAAKQAFEARRKTLLEEIERLVAPHNRIPKQQKSPQSLPKVEPGKKTSTMPNASPAIELSAKFEGIGKVVRDVAVSSAKLAVSGDRSASDAQDQDEVAPTRGRRPT